MECRLKKMIYFVALALNWKLSDLEIGQKHLLHNPNNLLSVSHVFYPICFINMHKNTCTRLNHFLTASGKNGLGGLVFCWIYNRKKLCYSIYRKVFDLPVIQRLSN